MAITAQLHDGRTLEFPDGTDPSVVQATVKKVLGEPDFAAKANTTNKRMAEFVQRGSTPEERAAEPMLKPEFDREKWKNAEWGQGLDKAAYDVGGKVTDALAPHVPAEVAGGAGFLANVATQAVPALFTGNVVGKVAEPLMEAGAKRIMQSALKPPKGQVLNGNGPEGIQTMLDYGLNATAGGAEKAQKIIDPIRQKIADAIAESGAYIDPAKVASRVKNAIPQVNPADDVAAIARVKAEFLNQPSVQAGKAAQQKLIDEITALEAAKVSALQDAGRFKTTAAQQENLAHGGGVNLGSSQPVNASYMNVGATGERALSPSAYAAGSEAPRIAGRYTDNIQRVPEANSAHADALKIYQQRKAEEAAARTALETFNASGKSGMPVQLAQDMKQGTYTKLSKSYGEMKSADVEAQKALAMGLKEEIAAAVPGVGDLNNKMSPLINASKLILSRDAVTGNKDPIAFALLAHNMPAAMAMQASRSELMKSLLARGIYSGRKAVPGATAAMAEAILNSDSATKE